METISKRQITKRQSHTIGGLLSAIFLFLLFIGSSCTKSNSSSGDAAPTNPPNNQSGIPRPGTPGQPNQPGTPGIPNTPIVDIPSFWDQKPYHVRCTIQGPDSSELINLYVGAMDSAGKASQAADYGHDLARLNDLVFAQADLLPISYANRQIGAPDQMRLAIRLLDFSRQKTNRTEFPEKIVQFKFARDTRIEFAAEGGQFTGQCQAVEAQIPQKGRENTLAFQALEFIDIGLPIQWMGQRFTPGSYRSALAVGGEIVEAGTLRNMGSEAGSYRWSKFLNAHRINHCYFDAKWDLASEDDSRVTPRENRFTGRQFSNVPGSTGSRPAYVIMKNIGVSERVRDWSVFSFRLWQTETTMIRCKTYKSFQDSNPLVTSEEVLRTFGSYIQIQ